MRKSPAFLKKLERAEAEGILPAMVRPVGQLIDPSPDELARANADPDTFYIIVRMIEPLMGDKRDNGNKPQKIAISDNLGNGEVTIRE